MFTDYHGPAITNRLWTTYMARCPECEGWKELRDFRIGGWIKHWTPSAGGNVNFDNTNLIKEFFDRALCNACYAKKNSRAELAKALQDWALNLINSQLLVLSNRLLRGWGNNYGLIEVIPHMYRHEVRNMIRQNSCLSKYRYKALGYADLAVLNLLQSQAKDLVHRIRENAETTETLEN